MSYRAALSARGFRAYWGSMVVSRIGDAIHEVALLWIVFTVTNDPRLLSVTLIASFLPGAVLELVGGSVADRLNRKRLIIGTDVFRGVIVLAIPLVGNGPFLVPVVVAVAFLTGAADAVDGPARRAMVPNLVEDEQLDSANSLAQFTSSISQTLYVVGGIVITVSGSFAAFYVDAASFLLSAAILTNIPTESGVPGDKSTPESIGSIREIVNEVTTDIRFVVGYVSGYPLLVNVLFVGAAVQMVFAPMSVLMPEYATDMRLDRLGISESITVSVLYGVFFSGMTVGSLVVNQWRDQMVQRRGTVVVGALVSFGVVIFTSGVVPTQRPFTAVVALGLFFLAGACYSGVNIAVGTLQHLVVPDEAFGRFASVDTTITTVATIVGFGIGGLVVRQFGPDVALMMIGSGLITVAVVLVSQPIASVAGDLSVRPVDE